MAYIAVHSTFDKGECNDDILTAFLADIGFESFVATDNGLIAYIQEKDFIPESLPQTLNDLLFKVEYEIENIPDKDWNAEWEKNYDPIEIEDKIHVRAPFHLKKSNFRYQIEILPQMSFGTAHHATTYLMLKQLYNTNLVGKTMLDMGCGTSILGIFGVMAGAKHVDAIDIDIWAYNNSLENIARNNINPHKITVYQGGQELLLGKQYDVIAANINRNVLLEQIQYYAQCLSSDGILLMSGFYVEDIEMIKEECRKHNLQLTGFEERNQWVVVVATVNH